MNRIFFFLLFAAFSVHAQTDVVKFTAKIENRNGDTIYIYGPQNFKRVVPMGKNNTFTDSFSATTGPYQFYDGTEQTLLFLKNGYDLTMKMNAKAFDESIVFSGKGSKENNFLAKKALIDEKFEETMASMTDQKTFDDALAARLKNLEDKLADKEIGDELRTMAGPMLKNESRQLGAMFTQTLASKKLLGSLSPSFDYENFKGGNTKLEDFKGKYVYIDVWATWCGPCRAEIPHLQKIEERYHGKNIEFVSISIDERNEKKNDYEKWRKMVTDKSLGGVQLFADNAWNSKFIRDYGINSIPRFILIGPDGKIIDADAKRPSDNALQTQLDGLLK